MKKVLLATSVLAMTAGFASAEVTLSGSARMGIISDFGDVDTGFTSRARVVFTLSGETDSGISFGASFRADNASGANDGDAGEVFVSGAFGKLTMGDIDGAAQQAVGNVDGVGLTGLGDLNEAVYLHNFVSDAVGGAVLDPSAAYEYSTGSFTGIISSTNPNVGEEVVALGAKYAAGNYTVALGYETFSSGDIDHVILGVGANFGAVALKANYGRLSASGVDLDQYHLSATYTADALAITAFYTNEDDFEAISADGLTPYGHSAYGLGASYDLGGGAKVVGGYSKDETLDDSAMDLGLSFTF